MVLRVPQYDATEGYEQPLNINADALAAFGFYPQNASSNDENAGIFRDASGNLCFVDAVLGSSRTLTQLVNPTIPRFTTGGLAPAQNITSTTPAVITGTSTTPGAGTYLVTLNADITVPNGGTVSIYVYANGTVVTNSERQSRGDQGSLSSTCIHSPSSGPWVITMTAGQAIDGRASRTSGTAVVNRALLTLLKIG